MLHIHDTSVALTKIGETDIIFTKTQNYSFYLKNNV